MSYAKGRKSNIHLMWCKNRQVMKQTTLDQQSWQWLPTSILLHLTRWYYSLISRIIGPNNKHCTTTCPWVDVMYIRTQVMNKTKVWCQTIAPTTPMIARRTKDICGQVILASDSHEENNDNPVIKLATKVWRFLHDRHGLDTQVSLRPWFHMDQHGYVLRGLLYFIRTSYPANPLIQWCMLRSASEKYPSLLR